MPKLLLDPCDGDETFEIDTDEFLNDNETLSADEAQAIRALAVGQVYNGGGGAAAAWKVTRVA